MPRHANNGFTLIEVIISLSIFMGMTLLLAGTVAHFNEQILNATRKMETLDLKNRISQTLSRESVCSCLMAKFSKDFNSDEEGAVSEVSELRSSCASNAPLIAAGKEKVPGAQTQLAIKNISISDILSTSVAEHYQGKLKIDFKDDKRTILFKSLEINGYFRTNASSPSSAKKIEACVFGDSATLASLSSGSATGPDNGFSGSCPSGEYVTGFDSGRLQCSVVAMNSQEESSSRGPSSTNPGKGCDGESCVTSDYGPCYGEDCRTNGNFCDGERCIATGETARCEGKNCCAGPQCGK